MGKGSARRPGTITDSAWDAIFNTPASTGKCPVCNENVPRCVCAPTDDGPGQDEATDSALPYDQRRFNREGV